MIWYTCTLWNYTTVRLSNFTFTFDFHALETEMATHSNVLAWRIPGTGDPGGLPSMGSHRVRYDWSGLAAAAAARLVNAFTTSYSYLFTCRVRTFKICSLSNFQICNTVVLMVVTMLYVHYISRKFSSYKWKFVPFDHPFPPPSCPGDDQFTPSIFRRLPPSYIE